MQCARAALYVTKDNAAAILDARYPIPSEDAILATLSREGKLSNNALFSEALDYMANLLQRTFPEMVGGCFIAGTLVHTDKGLVPIEQIKVGDMVLSQPEGGGEIAYKRVVNTFTHEDKVIWVVKYSFVDGAVPDVITHNMVYHLYATENHPFWVDGKGWVAARYLDAGDSIRVASGMSAQIEQVWPVVRTPIEGIGWVSSDLVDSFTGIEDQGHVVNFCAGSNLWSYNIFEENGVKGVPHFGGMFALAFTKPFSGEDLYDIYTSDDPYFKTRVYNLEVEDFHTYYVGEFGVWVHNAWVDCFAVGSRCDDGQARIIWYEREIGKSQ
ncbi:MAG: Hint domain-containing protein [Rhodocyclaceae bacterium]|nr:Hint domain-containing protein [Rhodocyclaceae bacterium]